MEKFQHRFVVRAGIDQVATFHSDSKALKSLTPPPIFVQFHQVQPLAEGSIADFTMWIGPIPVRWTALHSQVDPLYGFSDTQVKGPFERWTHQHRFNSKGTGLTEVVDEVEAEPGSSLWCGLISRLMWLGLPLLFAYRAWITRRALEKTL